jgi:hypothetical protein
MGVVERLEVIHVDQEQRQRRVRLGAHLRHGPLDPDVEGAAVGQAGERVRSGFLLHLCQRLAELGDPGSRGRELLQQPVALARPGGLGRNGGDRLDEPAQRRLVAEVLCPVREGVAVGRNCGLAVRDLLDEGLGGFLDRVRPAADRVDVYLDADDALAVERVEHGRRERLCLVQQGLHALSQGGVRVRAVGEPQIVVARRRHDAAVAHLGQHHRSEPVRLGGTLGLRRTEGDCVFRLGGVARHDVELVQD